MCGRFTLRASPSLVGQAFGVTHIPEAAPRYNIAPSQSVACVRQLAGANRELVYLSWGLVPSWAKDPAIGVRPINARSETAAEKPTFRKPIRERRCLIVADGFYEWKLEGKRKQPYFIHRRDDQPFGMAGLWERWKRDDQTIESCAILTTSANAMMASLHERMPVILNPTDFQRWLDPEVRDVSGIVNLLVPLATDDLVAAPVNTIINNPRNDSPACIEPTT